MRLVERNEIALWISSALARHLEIDISEINVDKKFFEIGCDSIALIRLTGKLERFLERRLPVSFFWEHHSISMAASVLCDHSYDPGESYHQVPISHNSNVDDLFDPFPLSEIKPAYWLGRLQNFDLGNTASYFYVEYSTHDFDLTQF